MDKRRLVQHGLIALAISLSSGCGSQQDREKQYLEKAQNYYKSNNKEKAAIELKNVLQINPKNIDARYLMAQLAEKEQDWQKMYGLLQGIVAENPDRFDAQVDLGKLFLLSNEIAKATEKADFVLSKDAKNTDALNLKAAVLLRKENKTEAETLAKQVLAQDAGNIEATYILAKLYGSNKQYDTGLKFIDASSALHPEEINLSLIKLQLLKLSNKLEQAEALIKDMTQRFPQNTNLHYNLAKYYLELTQPDKAEQLLRSLVSNLPDDINPKLALVEFFSSQGNLKKAKEELLSYIKQFPKEYDFRFALAMLNQNDLPLATEILDQIVADDNQHGVNALKAKRMLTSYALKQRDMAKAKQLINEILADDAHNTEALLQRASFSLDEGKNEDAIADLRTVLRDQPNSEKAYVLTAKAQIKSGFPDLAQEALEKALSINPNNIEARIDLAKMLAAKKDDAAAIKLLTATAGEQDKPDDRVYAALADVYASKNDWDNAEKSAKAIVDSNKTGLGQFKLAQLYSAQKKYPLAIEALNNVLAHNPLALEVLTPLMETYVAMGEPGKALAHLTKLLKEHPDNIALLNLSGQLYKSQKQWAEAEKVFTSILAKAKNADLAYKNLGDIYFLQQQPEKALAIFQQGLAAMPNHIGMLLSIAEIYERIGDPEHAKSTYKQALSIAPDNKVIANNFAALISNTTEDPQQLREALDLIKSFKDINQAGMLDTYAWLKYLNGEPEEALVSMEKAVKLEPNFAEFNYHLGAIYAKNGRTEDAKQALQKALAKGDTYKWSETARSLLNSLK